MWFDFWFYFIIFPSTGFSDFHFFYFFFIILHVTWSGQGERVTTEEELRWRDPHTLKEKTEREAKLPTSFAPSLSLVGVQGFLRCFRSCSGSNPHGHWSTLISQFSIQSHLYIGFRFWIVNLATMATANALITMKEVPMLPSLGISSQFITFTHVTMESDKYLCVWRDGSTEQCCNHWYEYANKQIHWIGDAGGCFRYLLLDSPGQCLH